MEGIVAVPPNVCAAPIILPAAICARITASAELMRLTQLAGSLGFKASTFFSVVLAICVLCALQYAMAFMTKALAFFSVLVVAVGILDFSAFRRLWPMPMALCAAFVNPAGPFPVPMPTLLPVAVPVPVAVGEGAGAGAAAGVEVPVVPLSVDDPLLW